MRRTLTIAVTFLLVGCPPPFAYKVKRDAPSRVEIECSVKAVSSLPGVTNVVVNDPEPTWFQLDFQSPHGRVSVTISWPVRKRTTTEISAAGWRVEDESENELKERERFGQLVVSTIQEQCST